MAHEGIHFRTSSLAKGIAFGNFSLGKGMFLAFLLKESQILSKKSPMLVIPVETHIFGDYGREKAKFWRILSRKRQLMAILTENLGPVNNAPFE